MLSGGPGDDRLRGGAGDDSLTDGVITELSDEPGDDVLRGGTGADFFGVTGGQDRVLAGTGDDRVKTIDDGLRDLIDCGDGADRVTYYAVDGVGGLDPLDVLVGCERVTEAR